MVPYDGLTVSFRDSLLESLVQILPAESGFTNEYKGMVLLCILQTCQTTSQEYWRDRNDMFRVIQLVLEDCLRSYQTSHGSDNLPCNCGIEISILYHHILIHFSYISEKDWAKICQTYAKHKPTGNLHPVICEVAELYTCTKSTD